MIPMWCGGTSNSYIVDLAIPLAPGPTKALGQAAEGHGLLAWVPPQLVELAQKGIEGSPTDCILWVDYSKVFSLSHDQLTNR